MKRYLFFLAALLLLPPNLPATLSSCPAAEPAALTSLPRAADPLRIVIPSGDLLPGEDYDLPVSGLSVNDLVPGRILFLPPESANARVKLQVVWSLAGLEPVISFRAKAAGTYRIVVVKALSNEQLLTAMATVTVKGASPDPDPTPDPQPDPDPDPKPKPVPTKLTAVAIVEETAERARLPLAQRQLLVSLTWPKTVEAKGLKYRRLDPNDQLPPEWAAAVKAAGAKLPALVFLDASGGGEAIPLPADEAAATKELERRAAR